MRGYGPELACSLGVAALSGELCPLISNPAHPGTVFVAVGSSLATFGGLLQRRRHAPVKGSRGGARLAR